MRKISSAFRGAAVNEAAMDFLDGFCGEDLFLHLHYWDPHGPLSPPPEWIDRGYEPDTSAVTDEQLTRLAASPAVPGRPAYGRAQPTGAGGAASPV